MDIKRGPLKEYDGKLTNEEYFDKLRVLFAEEERAERLKEIGIEW